jgi:hypothetical protein
LTELPEALLSHLTSFLPQWDVGSLLQLFKEVRAAVGPAIHMLDVGSEGRPSTLKGDALLRQLRLCTSLQQLEFGDESLTENVERQVVEWIGNGAVGLQLRCLELSDLSQAVQDELVRHLKDGRLRHLAETTFE